MEDGVNRCARSLDGQERMKRTYDEPVTPQNWAMRSSLIFDFDLDCGGVFNQGLSWWEKRDGLPCGRGEIRS